MLCGCYSLRVGVAALTFAGCVALSARVLFGANASAFSNAALAGNVAPVVWIWAAVVVVGLWQTATGLNAALEHSDPIRPVSLAWSAAVIWLATYYLPHAYHPSDFTPLNWAWLQAVLIAWVAEHIANIWLQLRGAFRSRPRVIIPPILPPVRMPARTIRRTYIEEESFYGDDVPVVTVRELPEIPLALLGKHPLPRIELKPLPRIGRN